MFGCAVGRDLPGLLSKPDPNAPDEFVLPSIPAGYLVYFTPLDSMTVLLSMFS
jgi:hypothetical protein